MRPHLKLAEQLGEALKKAGKKIVTAESCTGGEVAAAITDIAGSSDWFERGFVTYSNQSKIELLGVAQKVLDECGAVSEETVKAMAEGALKASDGDLSVAISGIAGPAGGTEEKPVGMVWLAWAEQGKPAQAKHFHLSGSRASVRRQATKIALKGVLALVEKGTLNSLSLEDRRGPNFFFALWPTETVKKEIAEIAKTHINSENMRPTKVPDLHLTLSFLGSFEECELQKVLPEIAKLQVPAFDLELSAIKHWRRAQVLYLAVKEIPDPLIELVEKIKEVMATIGFEGERRRYVPHVTLAKRAKTAPSSERIEPIHWPIENFHLARTSRDPETSRYEILESWKID